MAEQREAVRETDAAAEGDQAATAAAQPAFAPTPPVVQNTFAIVDKIAALLLIVLSIFMAATAIVEHAARSTVVANIQRSIIERNLQIAGVATANSQPDAAVASSSPDFYAQKKQLEILRDALDRARAVEVRGSFALPLPDIQVCELITVESVQLHFSRTEQTGQPYRIDKCENLRREAELFFVPHSLQPNFIAHAGSEALLVISLLACGALGSLLAGLWVQRFTSPRDFGLGLGAGFVVYLAAKGGKFLFTMPNIGDAVALNPYGMAFTALLVGLYLNRAYEFLGAMVDRLTGSMLDRPGKAS